MKRVFLQEAKIASSHNFEAGLAEAKPQKQELSGGNRKARTSAAMLGLALSMGASGVIFHRDSEAVASEPMTAEPAFSASPMPQAVSSTRHIVREGQTLWQIAQEHQVDISALAAINGLSPDALLPVGTALQVPAKAEMEVAVQPVPTQQSVKPESDSVGKAVEKLLPERTEGDSSLIRYEQADRSLKTAQDESLTRLRQSSDELNSALASVQPTTGAEGSLSREESSSAELNTSVSIPVEVETSTTVAAASLATEPSTEPSVDEWVSDESPLTESQGMSADSDSADGDEIAADSAEVVLDSAARVTVDDAEQIAEVPVSFRSMQDSSDVDELPSVLPQIQVDQPLLGTLSTDADSEADTAVVSMQVATNAASAVEVQTQSSAAQTSYQIRPGDTLNRIAREYGVTREQLISANNISNPNVIWAGATLIIPGNVDTLESASPKEAEIPVEVAASRNVSNLIERPAQDLREAEETSVATEVAAIQQRSSAPTANSYDSGTSRDISPYAARLLEEIREMRSRQAEQAVPDEDIASEEDVKAETGTQIAAIAPAQMEYAAPQPAATVTDEPVNPEFERQNQLEDRTAEDSDTDSQLIAAAPVGSESYAPLAQPVSGQMVSPELPSLPGAEEYLPEAISNGYIWPAQGVLTSGYGWRWGRMHKGIDVAAPVGTPIYAAASGVVERSGWNSGGYGNLVDIRHPDGSLTRYAHNSRLLVSVGQRVRQGEQIAEMGSTGYSTGPHVHFEIHPPNQGATNPMAYLPSR